MFTKEELTNILVLINKAPISGLEAMTVAMLIQKIESLRTEPAPQNNESEEK